ncbi:MAG: hypothetical protein AB1487_02880 [Thermodesulfobacteriota bacterium]
MARKRRIEFPHAFYHVLARGNRKQEIFLEGADYYRFLNYLKSYREWWRGASEVVNRLED